MATKTRVEIINRILSSTCASDKQKLELCEWVASLGKIALGREEFDEQFVKKATSLATYEQKRGLEKFFNDCGVGYDPGPKQKVVRVVVDVMIDKDYPHFDVIKDKDDWGVAIEVINAIRDSEKFVQAIVRDWEVTPNRYEQSTSEFITSPFVGNGLYSDSKR